MLRDSRAELDPVSLLHTIRQAQSALATINATDSASAPQSESLEHFLRACPSYGDRGRFVLHTHRRKERLKLGVHDRTPLRAYGARY